MIVSWPQGRLSSTAPSGARWGAAYSDTLGNTFVIRPYEETVTGADTREQVVKFNPDDVLLY